MTPFQNCAEHRGHQIVKITNEINQYAVCKPNGWLSSGRWSTVTDVCVAIDMLEDGEDRRRAEYEREGIINPNRATNITLPQLGTIRSRLRELTGNQIELIIDGLKGIVDYAIDGEDAGEEDKRRGKDAQEILNHWAK